MGQFTIQNAFNKGEISPKLHARSDISHWKGALARAVNMLTFRQGGARKRPGTVDFGPARTNDDQARLVSFVFSRDESYTLEFTGDQKCRVWSPLSGLTPVIFDIPWLPQDYRELHFSQAADKLYVYHELYPTREIRRYSASNWTIETCVFEDGPYQRVSDGNTHLSIDADGDLAIGGSATASSSYGANAAGNAFDGNPATFWEAAGYGEEWVEYFLPAPKAVNGYVIQIAPEEQNNIGAAKTYANGDPKFGDENRPQFAAPRTWRFEAWNGGAWVVLDEQFGETGWGPGERQAWKFVNKIRYDRYRLVVTARNDVQDQRERVRISALQLQGYGEDAGLVNVYLSNTTDVNFGQGFLPTDVNRQIRVVTSGIASWMQIVGYVGPTHVIAGVRGTPFARATTFPVFFLGSFSATTGYASTGCFFKERHVLAATIRQPQSIWMSRIGNYYDFGVDAPIEDDDGISFTLSDTGKIQFVAEFQTLAIGTVSAGRVLDAGDPSGALSPKSFRQSKQVVKGFSSVQPPMIENSAMCPSLYGRGIQEFKYDPASGQFSAAEISVLSEHLFNRSPVVEICTCAEPDALVWMLTREGKLISMTYDGQQELIAYNPHEIGGNGRVLSICSIPGVGGDYLWMLVKRNGQVRVEVMSLQYEGGDPKQAVYLDGARRYQGPPVSSITGIGDMEGQYVHIYGDGAMQSRLADDFSLRAAYASPGNIRTNQKVQDGKITWGDEFQPCSTITVGYPYFWGGQTLRVSFSQAGDAGLGRKHRINNVIFDVMDTLDMWAWSKTSNFEQELLRREFDDLMGDAMPLYTGTTGKTSIEGSHRDMGQIFFGSCSAHPGTIRAIMLDVTAE